MIRIVNTRLVVEKQDTHAKYYPKVISASTQQSYPFSISSADITVVSNILANTSGYAAPINFDDIVRLQVSIKYHRNDRTVWQDIFHGRVENLSSSYGTSNQLNLYCVGHEGSTRTSFINTDVTYSSPTDAKVILAFLSTHFSRINYSSDNVDTGVIFPTFDATENQMTMQDFIGDMETNSGFDWSFKVIPTYTSAKNYNVALTQWKPFTTAPTQAYRVIEGTQRLISADFDVTGEGVRTYRRIYGDTPEGGTQYTGSAYHTDIINRYGIRSEVDTYPWIKSDALCTSVADGLLSDSELPVTSGQVILIGTPPAQIGDYVYCKIPSEEINGASIDDHFYVYRVQHQIDKGTFQTTLDLGKVKKVAEDYIAQVAATTKLCKKSLVKG